MEATPRQKPSKAMLNAAIEVEAQELVASLASLLATGDHADLTLQAPTWQRRAHRALLGARWRDGPCKEFLLGSAAASKSELADQVQLPPHVDEAEVDAWLELVYTGRCADALHNQGAACPDLNALGMELSLLEPGSMGSACADVQLVLQGDADSQPVRLDAHRCILAVRCQFFATMFSLNCWAEAADGVIQVQTQSCSAATALDVVRFLYTAAIEIDVANAAEVLCLADQWQLEGLVGLVATSLRCKVCRLFGKPAARSALLQDIPQVGAFAAAAMASGISQQCIADLHKDCLTWMAAHAALLWPLRPFAAIPHALQQHVLDQALASMTVDSSLQTLADARSLVARMPAAPWAARVRHLAGQLHEGVLDFITSHIQNLATSPAFHAALANPWFLDDLEAILSAIKAKLAPLKPAVAGKAAALVESQPAVGPLSSADKGPPPDVRHVHRKSAADGKTNPSDGQQPANGTCDHPAEPADWTAGVESSPIQHAGAPAGARTAPVRAVRLARSALARQAGSAVLAYVALQQLVESMKGAADKAPDAAAPPAAVGPAAASSGFQRPGDRWTPPGDLADPRLWCPDEAICLIASTLDACLFYMQREKAAVLGSPEFNALLKGQRDGLLEYLDQVQ
ncbi:hypothetical protein WJX72_006704 [[Myrmecia] bisecta]|uniref:BTB domain-containing protein n=1 Tax=[Myrmecia] bisecta TaxID=41462 RepID=A0AAW1PT81_9CHLO